MYILCYRLVTALYFLSIRIAAWFHPKAKLAIAGRRHLFSKIETALSADSRPRIWMHCASAGELEQGKPLLQECRKAYPNHALVLTFFSPSGFAAAQKEPMADHVFYLPFDTPSNARKLVKLLHPKWCVFVKYEYWYFLLKEIKAKRIPAYLLAAVFRKKQPFFQWYGTLHRQMLHCFSHLLVQDEQSAQMLAGIGIQAVSVVGDPRFDRVLVISKNAQNFPEADAFCKGKKVIVAGSTWSADEKVLKAVMNRLGDDWKLILVPHEVFESHISALQNQFGNEAVLWSEGTEEDTHKRVLIVDKTGLLASLYRYAKLAFVGGGFSKSGIHNVLEAAVYGIPVLHGPEYSDYLEATALLQNGGSRVVANADEMLAAIKQFENDEALYEKSASAARNYVVSNGGATSAFMAYLRVVKS